MSAYIPEGECHDLLEPCDGGDDTPGEIQLTNWRSASGGVSVVDNANDSLKYSGSPTGWDANSITTSRMSNLGVSGNYSVSWTVGSNPASTTWVVGLGITESSRNWRDVDFGMRCSEGRLKVYENGVWQSSSKNLASGDKLEIFVGDQQLEYRLNGSRIYSRPIQGNEDFYLDTSFKNGYIRLDNFLLITQ